METILQQSITRQYTERTTKTSVFTRFFNYCKGQQNNRLLWVGVALAGHGCIITPITVMAILLAGSNLFLLMLALVAMGISLVTNLAAMTTKVTIPALVLSIIIDVAIIISCIAMGFDISKTYI